MSEVFVYNLSGVEKKKLNEQTSWCKKKCCVPSSSQSIQIRLFITSLSYVCMLKFPYELPTASKEQSVIFEKCNVVPQLMSALGTKKLPWIC